MRPTGLQSDTFKFHLRKVAKLGYIEKTTTGQYQLTPRGKEFANNLDESRLTTQRQPKLSVLLIIKKPVRHDEPLFLFQKRLRNPFFGFWSCIGGPIQWGQDAEATAAKELKKQTGLTAVCKVQSFYRKRDYDDTTDLLLEDKLFIILQATKVEGELANTWHGGLNKWMTVHEFKQQPKYFSSVCEAIDMLDTGKTYTTQVAHYSSLDY